MAMSAVSGVGFRAEASWSDLWRDLASLLQKTPGSPGVFLLSGARGRPLKGWRYT